MEKKIIIEAILNSLDIYPMNQIVAYHSINENVITCTVMDGDLYKITIEHTKSATAKDWEEYNK